MNMPGYQGELPDVASLAIRSAEGGDVTMFMRDSLDAEVQAQLRTIGQAASTEMETALVARESGWKVAYERYRVEQRDLGQMEMEALIDALALTPPLPPAITRGVLLAAVDLFLRSDDVVIEVHLEGEDVRISASRCPTLERFRDQGLDVIPCGCFARRAGWYEALGLPLDEELMMLLKWDDPACEFIIHVPGP